MPAGERDMTSRMRRGARGFLSGVSPESRRSALPADESSAVRRGAGAAAPLAEKERSDPAKTPLKNRDVRGESSDAAPPFRGVRREHALQRGAPGSRVVIERDRFEAARKASARISLHRSAPDDGVRLAQQRRHGGQILLQSEPHAQAPAHCPPAKPSRHAAALRPRQG